ncbi:MAG: L-arabinose isomerase [Oscillospiraceae bacterium]|nr:L-arabinose isomerase [Oscillospiraceae bacterium]
MKDYEFWFITGSQHLYGPETLAQVEKDSTAIVDGLNKSGNLPCRLVFKPVVKTPSEITKIFKEAQFDDKCAGVITWMHTFSPSKMWINGLKDFTKPYLHFHTQFNRTIPWNEIDMDFMNLNQSAHGDREHGFIVSRLRKNRKVVVGYWEDEEPQKKIAGWMRSAVGYMVSQNFKMLRLGDNMRQVAVTEGDKVEAEIKLGWDIEYRGIGDLVAVMNKVTDAEVDKKMDEYRSKYDMDTDNIDAVRYQAKTEVALEKIFEENGYSAFTTNFEDLHGMEQLPGLAAQNLMANGYGFGGEGDWKVAAMTAVMKAMSEGLEGGTAFMEDYTYHLEKGNEHILGAHMLEVCPSISSTKPKIQVHELGIGGKSAPARLVFDSAKGDAIVASLIDMGGRLRLIVNDVKACPPLQKMPRLPVAGVMWIPLPNLAVSAEAWILSGGAHHSVLSYSLTAENMRDWAAMMDIEFIHIGSDTKIEELEKELLWNDLAYKLK